MSPTADLDLWIAVREFLGDPLKPPSVATRRAIDEALEHVLAQHWNASTDGVSTALIQRSGVAVTMSGGVHVLEGPSGYSLRPLAAELSLETGAAIRIGAASESTRETDRWIFADPTKIRQWEPTVRLPPRVS